MLSKPALSRLERQAMEVLMGLRWVALIVVLLASAGHGVSSDPLDQEHQDHLHGVGHVHMDTSCARAVSADFDRALALLHNFWYERALEAFTAVMRSDPECALAYWGAAMTYNHPFWDAPTKADQAAART